VTQKQTQYIQYDKKQTQYGLVPEKQTQYGLVSEKQTQYGLVSSKKTNPILYGQNLTANTPNGLANAGGVHAWTCAKSNLIR
jgi:hypothetical protein